MASRVRRGALTVMALAAVVFASARCSDDQRPDDGGTDGGKKACDNDSVCGPPEFICKGGFCEKNTCSSDADCTGGSCNLLTGTCQAGTTDGGTPTDGGGGGGACTTKYDCPEGKICKLVVGSKACVDPAPGTGCQAPPPGYPPFTCYSCNTTADCPRGFLCDFQKLCYPGCKPGENGAASPDCNPPKLCDPTSFLCASCSLSNPCPAGKTCVGGECATPTTCTTTAECKATKDGTVCLPGTGGAKYCSGCTATTDCKDYVDAQNRPNRVCAADGLCKTVGECTDANCKQLMGTQKAYCDTASMTCKTYECTSDADCSQAMPTCDLVNHVCVQTPAGCDAAALQQCEQQCQLQGSTCNPATCNCGGTTPGSGAEGEPCTVPTDCAQGLTCSMGMCMAGAVVAGTNQPCDMLTCVAGGCVSSADPSYACDGIMCLLGGLMGGGGGTSSGTSCTDDSGCQQGEVCAGGFLGMGATCQLGSGTECMDNTSCTTAGETCSGAVAGMLPGRCVAGSGGGGGAMPCM